MKVTLKFAKDRIVKISKNNHIQEEIIFTYYFFCKATRIDNTTLRIIYDTEEERKNAYYNLNSFVKDRSTYSDTSIIFYISDLDYFLCE